MKYEVEIQPVNMLSLTMQVPRTSTASQGMIIPFPGITMTSPGTSSVDMACSISVIKIKREDAKNYIIHTVSAEINNPMNLLLNNK